MSIPDQITYEELNKKLNDSINRTFKSKVIKTYQDHYNNTHTILEIPASFKPDILALKSIKLRNKECTIRIFRPARRCSCCQS